MFKKIFSLIFLTALFFSCKTTTEPIVYNRDISAIDKENEIIQILIRNENFIEAEKHIEKNLVLYPDNPDVLLMKAWFLLQTNKIADAESLFLKLLEKSRKNPLALTGMARIKRRTGKTAEALSFINEGLNYLSTNSFLWLEKGIILFESKDYKKAYIEFSKAYNLDSKNYDAYFFKYLTMLKMNRNLDDVKQYWESLLNRKNLQSWYFQLHADTLYSSGYKDYAANVVKEGLDHFANDPYLLNMLSFYLCEEYRISKDEESIKTAKEKILKCLEQTKELKPEFVDTYFLILERSNETDLLKKELDKYKKIFPDSELISGWNKKTNK